MLLCYTAIMNIDSVRQRNYIIDILKVLCCFFVFRIHMGSAIHPVHIAEEFILLAVPIFIFLTGYNYTASAYYRGELTLKKSYPPPEFLIRFYALRYPMRYSRLFRLFL